MIERSREVPVVVDFWAEWCGPCRTLGPALEAAVDKRAGEVELVKVDTDRNPNLAMSFQIRGIPAVKAFRDGKVVAEFTGAIPPAADRAVPRPARPLPGRQARRRGRRGLAAQGARARPRHAPPRPSWHACCWRAARPPRRSSSSSDGHGDFEAEGLAARARLTVELGDERADGAGALSRSFSAWDAGDPEAALEGLQEVARRDRRSRAARPGAQRDGGDLHRARRRPSAGSGAPPPARRGTQLN